MTRTYWSGPHPQAGECSLTELADFRWLYEIVLREASISGATPSGLVQWLVDEGLRMAEHPGVVFEPQTG